MGNEISLQTVEWQGVKRKRFKFLLELLKKYFSTRYSPLARKSCRKCNLIVYKFRTHFRTSWIYRACLHQLEVEKKGRNCESSCKSKFYESDIIIFALVLKKFWCARASKQSWEISTRVGVRVSSYSLEKSVQSNDWVFTTGKNSFDTRKCVFMIT